MKKILKYNLQMITIFGFCVLLYTILNWNTLQVTQRIVGILLVFITLHVWEEMKFPGGFVDLVVNNMGLPVRDMTIPKFLLFLFIIWLGFIPFLFPSIHWMSAAPIILGTIEVFAHLVATRLNKNSKFYSPGMYSALVLMLPITTYGYYYYISNDILSSLEWLYAFLYLFIPLIMIQRFIVTKSGMKYSDFVKNATTVLFGKKKK